jgi:hypothetical protein
MHDHVYYRYHTYITEPVAEQVLVRVRASVLVHFVTSRGFDIFAGRTLVVCFASWISKIVRTPTPQRNYQKDGRD